MASNCENLLDLTSFCKSVMKELCFRLDSDSIHSAEVLFEKKCSKLLSEIEGKNINLLPDSEKYQYLRSIAQFILDVTYIDECKLVEDDFSEETTAYSRIMFIIDTLNNVENLAHQLDQKKSCLEILGLEMMECLHWRKGALLYMYCHTLNSKSGSSKHFPPHYQKCLESGVQFLKLFLSVRETPRWIEQLNGEVSSYNEVESDESFLFSEGIYSDIHLLALMYCGELCYWLVLYASCSGQTVPDISSTELGEKDDETLIDKQHISLAIRTFHLTGLKCLTIYIKSAAGPLSPGGWKTTRAEDLVSYFHKMDIK